MENRGEEERRKGNGRMKRGTERETTEGQGRGEKRGWGRISLSFGKACPWQGCLGTDYSNTPKPTTLFSL